VNRLFNFAYRDRAVAELGPEVAPVAQELLIRTVAPLGTTVPRCAWCSCYTIAEAFTGKELQTPRHRIGTRRPLTMWMTSKDDADQEQDPRDLPGDLRNAEQAKRTRRPDPTIKKTSA
jgi:hypothetical protein